MCGVLPRCVTPNSTKAPPPFQCTYTCTDQVISALHRRFPTAFTPALVAALNSALAPSNKLTLATMAPEQREKEEAARVTRQRPILRLCAELALVGVIRDSPTRSGGEWILKALRDLVCFFRDGIAPHLV
jgi:hypothetical protein